jgi:hypothetical protein
MKNLILQSAQVQYLTGNQFWRKNINIDTFYESMLYKYIWTVIGSTIGCGLPILVPADVISKIMCIGVYRY